MFNYCTQVGKLAIIAQKLQRVACNRLHMKPRHYRSKLLEASDTISLMAVDALIELRFNVPLDTK